MEWKDAVAVVTGASSGIGRATALELARRGCTVAAVARRADRLEAVAAECRKSAPASRYWVHDLACEGAARDMVAAVLGEFGRIDVLVNNAAIAKHKHIGNVEPDEVARVVRVNTLAPIEATLAVLPAMIARGGGVIVNVSSFAARVVPPREAVYAASKAALSAFTEGLWHDLAGSGVHAVLVEPGPIDTEIWEKAEEPVAYSGPRYSAEWVAKAIARAIERRRFEITVPSRSLQLIAARLLRFAAPGLLRRGMARMDPVAPEIFRRIAARAQGHVSEGSRGSTDA